MYICDINNYTTNLNKNKNDKENNDNKLNSKIINIFTDNNDYICGDYSNYTNNKIYTFYYDYYDNNNDNFNDIIHFENDKFIYFKNK